MVVVVLVAHDERAAPAVGHRVCGAQLAVPVAREHLGVDERRAVDDRVVQRAAVPHGGMER
jgi:hypothetical protein